MSNRRRHVGNREEPTVSKCVGVFGLSLYTTERELEKEFSKFGPLEKVTVILDGKVQKDCCVTVIPCLIGQWAKRLILEQHQSMAAKL